MPRKDPEARRAYNREYETAHPQRHRQSSREWKRRCQQNPECHEQLLLTNRKYAGTRKGIERQMRATHKRMLKGVTDGSRTA